tara:strand:- start:5360 stop:6670 length:1311 start_codon:yes stop_codon:yes gene_type:complete
VVEFFNRKEEVLDLKLSKHGERLLRDGKLDPVYYAFYDDDVIYDVRYASATSSLSQRGLQMEEQSEITERIFETPRLKVFHQNSLNSPMHDIGDYGGITYEEEIWETVAVINESGEVVIGKDPQIDKQPAPSEFPATIGGGGPLVGIPVIQNVDTQSTESAGTTPGNFTIPGTGQQILSGDTGNGDTGNGNLPLIKIWKNSQVPKPPTELIKTTVIRTLSLSALGLLGLQHSTRLGNSSLHSDYAPAWDIKLLTNEISGAVKYFPSGSQSFQLGINEQIPQINVNVESLLNTDTEEFEKIEDLVFSALEANGVFEKENLEIEVFLVDESGCRKKDLTDDEITTLKSEYASDHQGASEKQQQEYIDSLAYEGKSCPMFKPLFFADAEELGKNYFYLDEDYVEYWFNVFTDEQIDTDFVKAKPTQVYNAGKVDPEEEC